MHLDHIRLNFEKHRQSNGLQVALQPAATDDMLEAAEIRIGRSFPNQVRAFYSQYNGFSVVDPAFEVLSLDQWTIDDQLRIHFATADVTRRICFDCSRFNEAGQWDIIDGETGNRITLTMASFWTIHMWKWIDRRIKFWLGDV